MYEEDLKLKRKEILTITLTSIISALIIYALSFLKIDSYLKDIMIPFMIMLSGYVIIINKIKLAKNKKAYNKWPYRHAWK